MKLQYLIYISLAIMSSKEEEENKEDYSDYTDDYHGYMLPRTVIPVHYKLKVKTFLEDNNFQHKSYVEITVRCIKSTNITTLHSRDLRIKRVRLTDDMNNHIQIKSRGLCKKEDTHYLRIHTSELKGDNTTYKLKIHFDGTMARNAAGFYRSSYKDEYGDTRWIATTKFEPTHARAAFPCFDEPAMPATFSIHLRHHPNFTALSNMPLKSTKHDKNGNVWDIFEGTSKMSTYVIAYTIHDLKSKTTIKTNHYGNTSINVWAPKTSLQQVTYAIEIAPKLLSFFEEYFDIAYPLANLDFIAMPDVPTEGPEDWNLITFRETKLLFQPNVSSTHDKHSIASTMAYKIAHYWFGNFVTIRWWRYLWLKEGFASYLVRVALGHLFPNGNIDLNKDIIENLKTVSIVDSLPRSRPVSVPIHTPQTVYEIYDGITYSKGSCVIRMMELFLGSDVMKKGLKHYLKLHKYSSIEPYGLWNSLTEAADEDRPLSKTREVSEIMHTWTRQQGYPLIHVDRDYTSGTVTVTQKRFLKLKASEREGDFCYWVPLTYTTKEESDFKDTTPKKWLPCPKKSITFDLEDSQSWILFNVQASGLYRVNYDETNWKMLINELETNHKAIDTLNRVLLIDDSMELAMTGEINIQIAFDIIKYIRHDNETRTWCKALDKLLEINHLLENTEHHGLIKTYISNLLKPVYEKVGRLFSVKYFSELNLRIINTMCTIGNERCKEESLYIFEYWRKYHENYTIPVPIRSLVYCQGVKNGSKEVWEYMWKHYLQSDVAAEKVRIIRALACTEKDFLLERYLNWIIEEDSDLRPEDAFTVFSSVINNEKGSKIAREFLYNNTDYIFNMQSPNRPNEMNLKKYLREVVAYSLTFYWDFSEFDTNLKKYWHIYKIGIQQLREELNYRKKLWEDFPIVVEVLKNKQEEFKEEEEFEEEDEFEEEK